MKRRSFFARVFGLAAASAVAPEAVKAVPVKRCPGWTPTTSNYSGPYRDYYLLTNPEEEFRDFEVVGYAVDGGILELKPPDPATPLDGSRE